MQRLGTMGSWLRRRAEDLVVLLLASMFLAFLIQIAFRYFLGLPLGWTVEYVTIAWLWGIFFGYTFVVRGDEAIRLDIIYNAMPPLGRRIMDAVAGLACAAIFAWSLPKAWDYVTFMRIERTAFLQIRFDILFSVYLPFAVAVILRSLCTAWRAIRGAASYHDPVRTAASDEHA
jgi:TRAP-type C4-dicarboxylate transport system permease small subunit